jgi:hypothetical protein
VGHLSPWHGTSSGCGWSRWHPDMEGNWEYIALAIMYSWQGVALQLGGWAGLTKPHRKKMYVTKYWKEPQTWTDSLVQPMRQKIHMRFGTWNIRSLYRAGSLKRVARELGKCKLDLVGVQQVRWDKSGTERAQDYTFSMVKQWRSSIRDRFFHT